MRRLSGEEIQGGRDLPAGRESGLEEELGTDFDDDREPEEVGRTKEKAAEGQSNLKEVLQKQLQDVEQTRHDL